MFSQIVKTLCWEDGENLSLDNLCRSYLDYLLFRLNQWVKNSKEQAVIDAISSIDSITLQLLLTSPDISWRLLADRNDYLAIMLARELDSLLGGHEEENGLLFSADIAPLDYGSKYSVPEGFWCGEIKAYHRAEGVEICELVARAVESTRAVAPACGEFVSNCTSRIVVRRDDTDAGGFASGSFDHHAKVTFLLNPLMKKKDVEKICDALVHEAIHAYIYMFEVVSHPICMRAPNGRLFKSPWTGNDLRIEQYVQACFVWWGLFNFWRRAESEGGAGINRQRASYYKLRAYKGLVRGPVSSLFNQGGEAFLHPETGKALRVVEAEFRNLATKLYDQC